MTPEPSREGDGSRGGAEERAADGEGRRGWILVVLGLVVLQVALSLTAFHPAPHTGGDNAGYLTLAYSLLERGAYVDLYDPALAPHTKYPPLFPVVLAGSMLLGAREWVTFKVVSLVATTAAVVLVFLWARERRASLLFAGSVAALVALSDAVLEATRWILSDPLFVALTFLALWALARADRLAGWGNATRMRPAQGGAGGPGGALPWLVVGATATILAYFTRSAGLPLVVAVGVWMLLRRRWVALGGLAVGFGVPALLWWLRGRSLVGEAYVSEFWMANPYRPELGTVGLGGLVQRVVANARLYVAEIFPGGIVGGDPSALAFLGVVLTLLAVTGWGRRAWSGAGVAEIFSFLYLGLILLWPEVWSSDRFALPLYPLLLFYAGEALVEGGTRLHERGPLVAGALAVVVLALPALGSWRATLADARSCRITARAGSVWGCYPPGVRQFAEAARWSSANLPGAAAVLSRKPRIFFVLSGLPSRTYPFSAEPDTLLAEAEAAGARYLIFDLVGIQARRYLAPAIRARPGAFCSVAGFGEAGVARTELLGILPTGERSGGAAGGGAAVEIRVCPGEMTLAGPPDTPARADGTVPLLRGLDD